MSRWRTEARLAVLVGSFHHTPCNVYEWPDGTYLPRRESRPIGGRCIAPDCPALAKRVFSLQFPPVLRLYLPETPPKHRVMMNYENKINKLCRRTPPLRLTKIQPNALVTLVRQGSKRRNTAKRQNVRLLYLLCAREEDAAFAFLVAIVTSTHWSAVVMSA